MGLFRLFRNLRLGVKLIVVTMFGMAVLLVIVAAVLLINTRTLAVQTGRQRVEQEAQVIDNRFEEAEQQVLASAKLLASRPGLVEAVANRDATAIMTTILVGAAPLDLDKIDVVDADGASITTPLGESVALQAAQWDTLISFALLGIDMTGVIVDESVPALDLATALPLRDASGAIVGALLVSHRVDNELLEEINFFRDDVSIVLVAGGYVLAQDLSESAQLAEFSEALFDETAIGQAMSGRPFIANDLLLTRELGQYALAHIPLMVQGETYAAIGILVDLGRLAVFQSRLIGNTLLAFAFLTLMLVLAVGLFTRRSITGPMSRLVSLTQQVASGDYQQTAEVTTADEVGQLAGAFNSMAGQLQHTLESLEQRGADLQQRSLQLQASAEVASVATSVLDPDQLIQQIVNLIRERFDLYYVGLFLVDETGEWAVLQAGTGEAGRIMLARGHRIRVGEGMVGWSIAHAQARIAERAIADAARLATTELPNTRSEAALVLRSRGRTLGALTVQSDQPDAFDEQAIAVLQAMADQVAIAIDNARLFTESQTALGAARRAYSELSRQAWDELLHIHTDWGYLYANQSITPVKGDWRPEMRQAEQTGQSIQSPGLAEGDSAGGPALAIPIQVRGQVVGVLSFRKGDAGGTWTTEEITLLEALVAQLGTALESARLYQETQRRAAREQIRREATDSIRRAVDMDGLMQSTLENMIAALGVSGAFVRLSPSLEESEGGDDASS